jgi:hypothetical protein
MTDDELKEQFQRCQGWSDPEQWDMLGVAYYQRGFFLNALCCFRRADGCRVENGHETQKSKAL